MAPLFLEFAADRGEVATNAPELRASDRASLDAFREGAIDGRETARDSLHFRMGSRPGFLRSHEMGGRAPHALDVAPEFALATVSTPLEVER